MKKIYKSLLAIAASLLLVPTAFSQTFNPEKYLFDAEKGIGYNKYLESTSPTNGEYTLVIENFITGQVKSTAIPTDFVLVLDVSGSMIQNDYPKFATSTLNITKAANDAKDDDDYTKLKLDDGCGRGFTHYSYEILYSGGNVGASGSGTTTYAHPFATAGVAPTTTRWWYYDVDQTYYRILHGSTKVGETTYYYLYFRRKSDNHPLYLKQDGNNIVLTDDMPTSFTATNKVILIDNLNSSGYKLYRPTNRKDALKKGVDAFLTKVLEENNKDQWEAGVTKHQVSVVAFADAQSNDGITEATGTSWNGLTKVTKTFREITDDNIASYRSWDATCLWYGQTYIYDGVRKGRKLFDWLQTQPQMNALNGVGGTNRYKVMVVFTDGTPSGYGTIPGYTGTVGTIGATLLEGNYVKDSGLGTNTTTGNAKINGEIYTIDLSGSDYVPNFLKHLSSNYPDGQFAESQVTTGDATGNLKYKVTTPASTDYYFGGADASSLEAVFNHIAEANTGAMSSSLVAVDAMSDDFQIPFTTADTDKVTMYTAQCIGLKEIDGVNYLAFAEPVLVNNRPGLDDLWVVRDVTDSQGHTVPTWVNIGEDDSSGVVSVDIDENMSFKVTQDENGLGKNISFSGFNYSDLWCGEDLTHDNTRQMESGDPNAAYALPGYRGFKMIVKFPITIDPDALGGVNVPTNDWAHSGLFKADADGNPSGSSPEVNYPTPDLPIPVRLIIQKTGLAPGESANFTIQRRLIGSTDDWTDFNTFVLTGDASATPEVRIINLDPAYYYKVKEGSWSWAYENVSEDYYTTDPSDTTHLIPQNPIVFQNDPDDDAPKHAEAKATNVMKDWD